MASKIKRWSITSDKFLTLDQVSSLLEYLLARRDLAIARRTNAQPIRDYYGVRALLETGLRVAEFCSLTNGDFQGQKLLVRKGKGNKPRTVLLTKATALMLKEWATVMQKLSLSQDQGVPLFPSRYNTHYTTRGVQKRVKKIFGQVGFPKQLSVHSLRHTYCSLLLASGKVGIGTVRDNMGHHSITVTNLYAHAIGNLNDVELYQAPSSDNSQFSEPERGTSKKNPSSIVKAFLRNVNLK